MSSNETAQDRDLENRIIEALYVMDLKADVRGIPLGFLTSGDHEGSASQVAAHTDRLLRELGQDPKKWYDQLLGGQYTKGYSTYGVSFDDEDRVYFDLHGIGAGKYLASTVFEGLPIEHAHDGDATARISLAIGDDYIMELSSEGSFDTEYIFDSENADPESDDPVDSEIHYTISLSADLYYCPPQS